MTIRKILVVVLDNIGDAVMASAILPPLRRLFPEARIGFWVKSYAAPVFDGHPDVDRLHAADPFWDRSPGQAPGATADFISVWRDVRAEKYDVALVLNAEWRRSAACFFAGIPARVGLNRRKSRFFLTQALPVSPSGHFVDDHRVLLETWSGQTVNASAALPRLAVTDAERAAAQHWFEERGWLGKPILTFHPFAGDERKEWPLERWAKLLHAIAAKRPEMRFLSFYSPSEAERFAAHYSLFPREQTAPSGVLPVTIMKALLAESLLFVGGDSGPGHVAAALGVPVLSLFGSTHPARSRPMGSAPVIVLQEAPLSALPVDRVLKEVEQLWATKRIL